jgi:hypothetical protein
MEKLRRLLMYAAKARRQGIKWPARYDAGGNTPPVKRATHPEEATALMAACLTSRGFGKSLEFNSCP